MFQRVKAFFVKPTPHIYLARHGHTELNGSGDSADRIRGWLNVPLNDEGRKDAEEARKVLLKNEVRPNKIYASDLIRTMETASILNKSFGLQVEPTKDLRPWNLGVLQGQETKKIMSTMEMYVKAPDHPVPEGESFNTFKNRYLHFLQKVIAEAKEDGLTILLVTHFRNVKMAQAWVAEGMRDDLSVDGDVLSTKDVEPGDVLELPIPFK